MSLLEIERKFAFQRSLVSQFRRNMGNPPFSRLQFLGQRNIHDIYYDSRVPDGQKTKDILASHGVWVRRRNNIWEAKQRVASSDSVLDCKDNPYLRTIFKELSCLKDIYTLLSRYIPTPPLVGNPNRNFGLQSIIDFTTFREEYLADHRFRISLDKTCFGHRVGEIELLVEPGAEEQAQREVDVFMERYRWFFLSYGDEGKCTVKGKLTAYFGHFPVNSS